MIEVVNLWKSYGRHVALKGVSFQVPPGHIAGFLGPNGAGKTTAMRVLTSFLPPGSGRVKVAGFDVARFAPEVCRRVGYLPESVPVYPELRVDEYLRYRAVLYGLRRRERRTRVSGIIERCGLSEVSRQLLGSLSRGFRQRVGLADALLRDPEVLILDEPTAGLDPRQVADVRRMIESFRQERTVLLSSHILGEVEQVCDEVIILDRGEIRAQESRDGWRRRLSEAGGLELVLKDPPPETKSRLDRLKGVTDVQEEPNSPGDGVSFHLRTRGDQRLEVFALVKKEGWELLELRSAKATLESLFLEVTEARPAPLSIEVRPEERE